MEYDESGFLFDRPLSFDRWRSICPNEPHGLIIAQGSIPPGILMLQNYMAKHVCVQLQKECEVDAGEVSRVTNGPYLESRPSEVSDERISEYVNTDKLSMDVTEFIKTAWIKFVAPHYGVNLESYEKPTILRYRIGGRYIPHADSDFWDRDSKQWNRSLDRDLSMLIYITDDFQGGELVFSNFGYSLKPFAGLLVAFPSDHRYLHAARPVTEGVRYVIVSWAKAKGTPQIETRRRPGILAL